MSAITGNLPGFEEAARAEDGRDYAIRLAFADQEDSAG